MSKILYVDACGGAAGDMLAGAMFDLGWPLAELESLVAAMELGEVTLRDEPVQQGALAARRLVVEAPEEQPHRHLSQVLEHLKRLPEEVASQAAWVFLRLAEAEGKVHGISPDKVHFHEVGAVDAIVDVTAFCAALVWLGRPRLVCSPLPLGRGFVEAAHGRLPLPAPAVLNLLSNVPVTPWPLPQETVTPTGAALLSVLAQDFGDLPAMRLKKTGLGGGSRPGTYAPNVVRLLLGEEAGEDQADQVVEIVCHLDDESPEDLPIVFRRLLKAGALDVAAAPLYMKKGRPGLALTVMAQPSQAEELAHLVLEQTSTLGVRLRRVERRLVPREVVSLETPWGLVRVKKALKGGQTCWHPEADDVALIATQTGLPPRLVREKIMAQLAQL
ncbi:MAG: nickel pincer cofactor biosynthesis protein LarC [Deltaproteobacteria bacterium]|nr:nickel pincer cofactor biosynthesis protein LarC [Deltaproteobacteria bacterium]